MKSVVFSFKGSSFARPHFDFLRSFDVKYFCKRYLKHIVFVSLLLFGLALGAVFARNADEQLINSLDFLFTTNISARLEHDAFGIFSACFASDFIFIAAIFLLGLSPWGIPVMAFAVLFKGFGTGVTSGYLISNYSLTGAGFYLLILLPGTFLFCIALVMLSANSFDFSKQMFLVLINKSDKAVLMTGPLKKFLSHSMSALILTFLASIVDTALWVLLSGAFKF